MEMTGSAAFPFHLRIPGWCASASVRINGEPAGEYTGGRIIVLERDWTGGDVIELYLPMQTGISRWAENSAAVERGPLVYSLSIAEDWKFVNNDDKFGDYWEVFPASPWNFGLLQSAVDDPATGFTFRKGNIGVNPWTQPEPPAMLRTFGKRIPEWTLYYGNAGPLPHSRPQRYLKDVEPEEITLVPYGWSTLRITEFPVVE